MGAAVRDADGRMYGGVTLFHVTGGPCAELVAMGHARASGARELTTIVAVGNSGRGPVGPCTGQELACSPPSAARPASSRATGTRNGEQDT